jgi:hypothetical protein
MRKSSSPRSHAKRFISDTWIQITTKKRSQHLVNNPLLVRLPWKTTAAETDNSRTADTLQLLALQSAGK